jgi:hypothetical protein
LEQQSCFKISKCSVLFGGALQYLMESSLICWNSQRFLRLRVYMRVTALYDTLIFNKVYNYKRFCGIIHRAIQQP